MTIAEKLTQIAQNEKAVYNAGYATGYDAGYWEGMDVGYTQGYEEGKENGEVDVDAYYQRGYDAGFDEGFSSGQKAEYDRFWDDYQDNGTRTIYTIYEGGFAGPYWTDETFKPKYDMRVTNAQMMFRSCRITDLREETIGVSMDFSGCKEFNYCFAFSSGYIRHLPQIDISSATNLTSTFDNFAGTDLSLIVSETSKFATNTFNGVVNLVNLTISGAIGTTLTITSPLSKNSLTGLIGALSPNVTGQTLTISNGAVVAAFGDTNSQEWKNLVATKTNWKITLT